MILRILNPPHTGAQAEIGSDPLTIGSGMDCDLILNDPLLQPTHCKVRLSGEGIEIELLAGAAHLDAAPVGSSPFLVKPGQVLTIGSTHIAFGEPGTVWNTIVIPEIHSLGGSAPERAAEVPTAAPSVVSTPGPRAAAGLSRTFKIVLVAATTLALVAMLALFFYNIDRKKAMESMVRGRGETENFFTADMRVIDLDNKAADKVAERIRREVSGATVSGGERSGRAFLRIYLRTRSQANDVQKIVNSSPVPVFSEIVSLEEIEKSAEMMAGMEGFVLDASFAKDGTAYWTGYLPSVSDWKKIRTQLEKDIPYIKENINNLTYAADIEKRANALLAEAGIKSTLAFEPLPREIIITGTMPENQSEAWNKICAKLREEFGGMLAFTDRVGSGKPVVLVENPFHSPIAGVTLGPIPSLQLLDGQRFYEGAILKDGSVLTSITEKQIILTGPGGKRCVPLDLGGSGALE